MSKMDLDMHKEIWDYSDKILSKWVEPDILSKYPSLQALYRQSHIKLYRTLIEIISEYYLWYGN